MSQISAHNLRKIYGPRTVVHDVSFDVKSGEVVGLLGPNGAGKTTCFYMVIGLVAADGGSVQMDTHDLTHMAIHRRARLGLSYLPQEPSIFRKLTVEENIRAILELKPYSKSEREEHLDNLLNDLHIEHLREATAVSLSGGERRRVEIARALAINPRFILLDEPFPASIPSPCSTSRNWCTFWLSAISVYSSRTIMCVKPWAFVIAPTSSTKAGCSSLALPTSSFRTTAHAKCIWEKTSACNPFLCQKIPPCSSQDGTVFAVDPSYEAQPPA